MALTRFQSGILKALAEQRRARGESYVAGGVAINTLLATPRRSRDIDLFHDTDTTLAVSWAADRERLRSLDFQVVVLREARSFVEAMVERGGERIAMQWARDSAFRFFPLLEDDLMGLTMHPFDLATNKVLAMAGRLEVRDWIDVLNCDERIQPFGYLVWSACGKDPGYNPLSLLGVVRRSHYSQAEVDTLDFEGERPDAASLGRRWHAAQETAAGICGALPSDKAGTCVITPNGELFKGDAGSLAAALKTDAIAFHKGRIGGAWPSFL